MTTHRGESWTSRVLDPIADRNLRWDEIRRRITAMAGGQPGEKAVRLGPYVALSREAGAGGEVMAHHLGGVLGWRAYDKELLDFLAEQCKVHRDTLELLDETRVSWFDESVLDLVQPTFMSQDEYVRRLVKLVVLTLLDGPAILVGRGTGVVLPRQWGLSVRVVAEEADRLARVREVKGLDEKAARKWLHETDAARRDFLHRHFKVNADDPLQYDLVLNTSRLGIEGACEIVLCAIRSRGLAG